jgi:hypothetical protein
MFHRLRMSMNGPSCPKAAAAALKPIGRARVDTKIEDAIIASLASGKGILNTAPE